MKPQEIGRLIRVSTIMTIVLVLSACASQSTLTGSAQPKVTWPSLILHLHASQGAFLVDPATDQVVANLKTFPGANLGSTTPDARKVYIGAEAEGQRTVSVLDLNKREIVARIETGSRPKHPSVSPDGRLALINHWGLDGGKLRVTFIDTASDRIAKNVELDVAGQAKGPTSMNNAWSYDSRLAFTGDRVDDHLVVIDVRDWSVKRIKTPSKPHYVVPNPNGMELWQVVEGKDRDEERPAALIYSLPGLQQIARVDMPLQNQGVLEGHHGN